MLPLQLRMDLEAMAMKGCPTFPKAPASLESHHHIVQCHIQVASIAVIGVVGVGNCFCGVPSASFLCQLEAVFFDFINRCSKHVDR